MQMKKLLWFVARSLIGLTVIGMALWAALALWYTLPLPEWVRYALGLGLLVLGAGSLWTAVIERRLLIPLAPFLIAFADVLSVTVV